MPASPSVESLPRALAHAPWDTGDQSVRVTRVSVVTTAPAGAPLILVKVETDQPGLIGWGCASSPQRPLAIINVIENYLGPMLIGRNALDIEDFHHLMELSPYWRGGAIENNALAGLDIALWDIKGKVAGLPVHQLIGGRTRTRIPVYGHAHGSSHAEVIDSIRDFVERGYTHVRAQVAIADADTYGAHGGEDESALAAIRARSVPWLSRAYLRAVPPLFDAIRSELGFDVELLHDVHERLAVVDAIQLAKDLEPHRLFFLEDAIAPEDLSWYREMRQATSTPQAVGETFADAATFLPLVTDRLIDFARVRMGAIGGLTPMVKLAHLCEFHGVRLAIHGPGDISPIGHAASIHVDASSRAFGIQESVEYSDAVREVFPGAPVLDRGDFDIPTAPGIGVEVDEAEAARHPIPDTLTYETWSLLRHGDGSPARP
ncbi:starvation-sensing protein RspA [Microbacterium sp. SSW1-49]|uniref:Starvation-sensing protein RspA n=1 Tax=Microbacterium croceum TaxID=2851645 RepID=A0ABT0FA56_9MICO|nr:enolase C-terminal domain-like protein [Microbacterium croceum]MCK2034940.1 starvation-sensing protein RspA [Microbacterium croceum]